MDNNVLALIELIRARFTDEGLVIALYDLARKMGVSHDEITDALGSDRMLVIYEP